MSLPRRVAAVFAALMLVAIGARAQVLTEPVGTTSPVQTATLTVTTAGTLGAINVMTQGAPNLDFNFVTGGTCTVGAPYAANATCTVQYTFKPTHPGLRFGGISLVTSGSVVLGNAYVYGMGTGPQVVYSPATQSLLGGTYSFPTGVAVDAAGDVFLSDENANGVYEIPAGTGSASRMLGTFPLPDDVAVDGSGNVFVIYNRTALAEIMAVNGTIPPSPAINVISTNFSGLDGMKVDGNGNVYLAEGDPSGTGVILEVLAVNGSIPANPTILTLVSSNVGEPTGVAVDAAGDVFISDQLGNAYEALAVGGTIPASPTIVKLASGLNIPTNIALDAAGDVFVSVMGGVDEIVAVNGSVPTNPTVVTLGTNIVFAQGLAVDASGNVYIADDGTPYAVKLDYADAPSLTFATTQVGSTSTDSPQTVTVTNDGNANLTFLPPVSGTNPSITAGYTFTSTCPKLAAVTALAYAVIEGASCTESISFTPVAAGLDSGELTLTDNNLDVPNAQQNIKLNATGTIAPTTLTLTSSANPVYALQPVTFTVHLTTNGQGDASQSVTLAYTVGTLVVTAGLTTDSTGTASYTVTGGFDPGSYPVTATFAGTTSYQASTASLTQVVNAIPTTSTLTVFPAQPLVNTNVLLTVVVTPLLSGPAPGFVTFYNSGTALGAVAVSSAGVAQLSIGGLLVGNYSFSCNYSGATDYAQSRCATIAETVVPMPDFTLTATPPSITIETEHHKTMQLTLTPIGLFAGPVQLGCQGPLPPYVTCELPSSETLAVGQPVTFNFTMDTDAVLNFLATRQPETKTPWTSSPGRMALALLLPLALAGFARKRKALRRALLLAVLVLGATGLSACGNKWPAHTPPGTYTIPVVGTGTLAGGTTISHTLNITLTVAP